jgi:hypothetical protein
MERIYFEAPNNGDERPHRVESYEPDMAAHCDGEPEEKLDDMAADLAVAGAVMNEILQYVIGERSKEIHFPSCFRRFVSVIWVLRPEMLHEASLSQLAPQLSVTRQALSKAARRFADRHGGLRNRLMRSEETRRKCSAAQRANHWRRRKRIKPEGDDSGQAVQTPPRAS